MLLIISLVIGYIAQLSLVRICLLSKQVQHYKCTQTGVLVPFTTVKLGQAWCVHQKYQPKGCS
jgi:hypothetical protein